MEQKREPEIDPQKYNKLIFKRGEEITQWKEKKILSFNKIAGTLGKGKKKIWTQTLHVLQNLSLLSKE